MGTLVEIGTSFDVAVFQDGSPVVIATLVQSQPNLVDCFVTSFGDYDAPALAELLAMVGEQLASGKLSGERSDDDPFMGNADFDLPF